jgi:hypothetical protein
MDSEASISTPRQSYLRSALYHDFVSQAMARGFGGAHSPSLHSDRRFIIEPPNKLIAAQQETESSQTAFKQNAPKFMRHAKPFTPH